MHGEMQIDYYKYVVSRNVSLNSDQEMLEEHIGTFNRPRDNEPEDFQKEIKKYLYGLNLIQDITIETTTGGYYVEDKSGIQHFASFTNYYKSIKKKRFSRLINEFNMRLRQNYFVAESPSTYGNMEADEGATEFKKLKEWYMYISNVDKGLLFSLITYMHQTEGVTLGDTPTLRKFLNIKAIDLLEVNTLWRVGESGKDVYMYYVQKFEDVLSAEEDRLLTNVSLADIDSLVVVSDRQFSPLEANQRKHIGLIRKYYQKERVKRCDCCNEEAFVTQAGTPYLEYHHLVPVGNNGPDHVLNLFGFCPRCHRKFHFAKDYDRKALYEKINGNNALIQFDAERFNLYNRYKYLYIHDKINLLGLDFLVAERALTSSQVDEIVIST